MKFAISTMHETAIAVHFVRIKMLEMKLENIPFGLGACPAIIPRRKSNVLRNESNRGRTAECRPILNGNGKIKSIRSMNTNIGHGGGRCVHAASNPVHDIARSYSIKLSFYYCHFPVGPVAMVMVTST